MDVRFDTILIQVFNLCYLTLGSIFLTVLNVCVFRHRGNFSNCQQCFSYKNFRLKLGKFQILMVSSEISGLYQKESILFWILKTILKSLRLGKRSPLITPLCLKRDQIKNNGAPLIVKPSDRESGRHPSLLAKRRLA